MKWRRAAWLLVALPLFGMPLIAGEPSTEPAAPAQPAGATTDASAATTAPEQASQEPPEPADERISADNSLSYPVDI
jgi:hypothetical protein